ncbi:hypothetical protein C370_07355 [Cryptococcus neoformans A1-35-8]|nr:hypothetical protein C369_07383 [Cryptococcus neoformans var. grubii A5-35-17]OXH00164.1 hypothetical protein C370_07355 [Cryptococcus neoformans var. grubii A1-35-8]
MVSAFCQTESTLLQWIHDCSCPTAVLVSSLSYTPDDQSQHHRDVPQRHTTEYIYIDQRRDLDIYMMIKH